MFVLKWLNRENGLRVADRVTTLASFPPPKQHRIRDFRVSAERYTESLPGVLSDSSCNPLI